MQCNRCKPLVTLTLLLLAGAAAGVRAAESEPEAPCSAATYRAFDFWLGTWEVAVADGRRAGRNHITSEQGGCLLVERWQGVRQSTGTSMNFYDPAAGAWNQVWVSPDEEIEIAGGLKDGAMVLEGSIVYLKDGQKRPFRGTWTLLEDGRVRQLFEERNDDGRWTTWFEGYYTRVESLQ